MSEQRRTTIIDLSGCLPSLLVLCGVPAFILLALIVGQVVIYGGWHD